MQQVAESQLDAGKKPPVQEVFINLKVIYNGQVFDQRYNLNNPLRVVFNRAIEHFGISQGDAQNLGLFHNNNLLQLDQKIHEANLPGNAELILRPLRQSGG